MDLKKSHKPIKCWQYFNCGKSKCPAYRSDDLRCWLMAGTQCHDGIQGPFVEKIEMCIGCHVFNENMHPGDMAETCRLVSKQFSAFKKEIEDRDQQSETLAKELTSGLSEVSGALEKIAAGDPSVRIPETSGLAQIRELKKLVNTCAENLSDIVELAHEFAIGLAEHFNVLHQVAGGELSARIKGVSKVELLESLKDVTNQTIESVAREIADHRQTEESLRESETRFRTFAEKAPIGITIMRPDLTYEYINPTFTDLFGYTRKDLPDKNNWFEKVYPDENYRSKVMSAWEGDFGKPDKLERKTARTFKIHCKNGEDKIVSMQTVVLPDGRHFVTYTDVTEKAEAEDKIKQSEEKYRTLIDNMQDGVFINQDGILQFANGAMANMLGYTTEDMIGKPIEKFIAFEDREIIKNNYERRISQEEVENEYEVRLRHRDGVSSIIAVINVALFTYQGKPAAIGTVKDITERKRAEQEKLKLEAQLQRSQKMEAIGTLAGGVAHDLNNILSGIVSYPELLLMDLPSNSHLQKPIQLIQQSGEKAAAIVQDLLTLARRGVAVTKVVNLNMIVTEFLKSPEFGRLSSFHTQVDVEVDLSPDLHFIHASPVHISKTIMNLVSNAAEAMPEGGRVMISTANKYVDKPIKGYDEVLAGNYATLTVSDTGVGISPNDLEKIFEPFYTKKVMGRSGTGLGMAVVWGTVKDHNGYIDVLSAEKRGTTFTIYLPATDDAPRKEFTQLPIEEYMGQGETILVVDDMVEQREIASAMLNKLGYQVHAVPSGETAVDFLKDRTVDLVVLDMIMKPGIDGLETYRRILKLRPDQKAIVASGFSLSQRVKEIQKLGAAIYLKKPYSIEKLGMAVRSELEK